MKLKKSLAITFTDKEVDLLLKIRKDIQKTCVHEHCYSCKFNATVFCGTRVNDDNEDNEELIKERSRRIELDTEEE